MKRLHLPGNLPPWTDTGLVLRRGERVTWLAEGKIYLSEELGLFRHGRARAEVSEIALTSGGRSLRVL